LKAKLTKLMGYENLRVFNMKNQWGVKNALICRGLAWQHGEAYSGGRQWKKKGKDFVVFMLYYIWSFHFDFEILFECNFHGEDMAIWMQ